LSDIPDPAENEMWNSLCANDRWKYMPVDEKELYFGVREGLGEDQIRAIRAEEYMHPGSFAPKWVFQKTPVTMDENSKNSLQTYMQRLICAISGRFVVMEAGGSIRFSDGKPQTAERSRWPQTAKRYRWRHWDNDGNVYESAVSEEWHGRIAFGYGGMKKKDVGWEKLMDPYGCLPGDFRTNVKLAMWTRFNPGEKSLQNVGEFWESIWRWKYEGTTYCSEWDQQLTYLAKLAGVSITDIKDKWPMNERELDPQALAKGWDKVTCK